MSVSYKVQKLQVNLKYIAIPLAMELNALKGAIIKEAVSTVFLRPDCMSEVVFSTTPEKLPMSAITSLASLILSLGSGSSGWWWILVHDHKLRWSNLLLDRHDLYLGQDVDQKFERYVVSGPCSSDYRTQGMLRVRITPTRLEWLDEWFDALESDVMGAGFGGYPALRAGWVLIRTDKLWNKRRYPLSDPVCEGGSPRDG